jgi:hypothetical protein
MKEIKHLLMAFMLLAGFNDVHADIKIVVGEDGHIFYTNSTKDIKGRVLGVLAPPTPPKAWECKGQNGDTIIVGKIGYEYGKGQGYISFPNNPDMEVILVDHGIEGFNKVWIWSKAYITYKLSMGLDNTMLFYKFSEDETGSKRPETMYKCSYSVAGKVRTPR